MRLSQAYPVKLTRQQSAALAELQKRTGLNRSQLLRAAVYYFLDHFANRPAEVLSLFAQQSAASFSTEKTKARPTLAAQAIAALEKDLKSKRTKCL